MIKQERVKKVDHRKLSKDLNSLMERMFDFRFKYSLSEASMWDIIHLYLVNSHTSKGCSSTMLMKKRYRASTGYHALRFRIEILIKKGLIRQEKNLLYPTELVYKDLEALCNP